MKADISRNTFRSRKHYSSVIMQQGRVLLDADFNEQASILLHYMRTLAADMIGPNGKDELKHGGPGDSFKITVDQFENYPTFFMAAGNYYVDGILCENKRGGSNYFTQPFWWQTDDQRRLTDGYHLVYLDVWERLITSLEDGHIREVALGDADTCARSQVVWQAKLLPYTPQQEGGRGKAATKKGARAKAVAPAAEGELRSIADAVNHLKKQRVNGLMAASLAANPPDPDPCITPPDSRYRGAENQLYRVEIHTPGTSDTATFKWSRDNGSVTFPITNYSAGSTGGLVVTLAHLGRDDRSDLEVNDWVEVLGDAQVLGETPGLLLKVETVDAENYTVTLNLPRGATVPVPGKNGLLRRWDHINRSEVLTVATDNAFNVIESTAANPIWLPLEDGIQVRFDEALRDDGSPRYYYSGDYWLIPARTNTGSIEWPFELSSSTPAREIPVAIPAHGVHHHYAPLAAIYVSDGSIANIEYWYTTTDEDGNSIDLPLRRSLHGIPFVTAAEMQAEV